MPKLKIVTISTKKGDAGDSYLANGQKVPKDDLVFEVLGDIDELNSQLGLVVAQLRSIDFPGIKGFQKSDIVKHLEGGQSNLYLLSGIVAGAAKVRFPKSKLEKIEGLGDTLQLYMAEGWTTKFLYPGGSVLGAHLDVARSVCRRCERSIVAHSRNQRVPAVVLQYINRLSDFLFILRCFVNAQLGVAEKQFSKD